MGLQHQLDAVQPHMQPLYALPGPARPCMRDITTPMTWIYTFLAQYVAVRATDPMTRNLLTYARLILQETQRHCGVGWLVYARVFKQQAACDPTIVWNELNASLLAATVLSTRSRHGAFCTLCHEADHTAQDCALVFLYPPGQPSGVRLGQGSGTEPPTMPHRVGQANSQRRAPRPGTLERICASWNRGQCAYPASCAFRHICTTCRRRGHRAKEYDETPPQSPYEINPFQPGGRGPVGAGLTSNF